MTDQSAVVYPSPWLNVEQAAQYIQQSTRTIYRAAGSGALRSVRINGTGEIRTTAAWLDDFLLRYARGGVVEEEVDATPVAPTQEVLAYVARRR